MLVAIQHPPGLGNLVRGMKTGGGQMSWPSPLDLSYAFRHFDMLTKCLIDYPLITEISRNEHVLHTLALLAH